MGRPGPGDWLANHPESGQTFDQYVRSSPNKPTSERGTIYVQPLGKFDAKRARTVAAAVDYMTAFFGVQVKQLAPQRIESPLSPNDFRMAGYPKHRQIRAAYILERILKPKLPADAAALVAFTNEDLFPEDEVNFVFGQSSLDDRVGVWSLYRLDDDADQKVFLQRTLKIAVHETAHMFGFRHCTKYECVMSGTNSLAETDRRPIDACPECMAKICWITHTPPAVRYARLEAFARRSGLTPEAELFGQKRSAVSKQ
jgi:archaemetzincin